MPFSAPQVRLLANAGPRIADLDHSGGGYITRVFYVEPYLAHPWIELFLKGTVAQNGAIWQRIKPHADPIKPWFYCVHTSVHPFAPETVTGQALSLFAPNGDFSYNAAGGGGGGQQQSVYAVLNAVDDHGMTNIVDFGNNPPLTPAQILQGGIQIPGGASGFPPLTGLPAGPAFSGKCGAFIVATYTPLIFLDGIPTTLPGSNAPTDNFDFVNPTWTPIEIGTQTGRNLFFYAPNPAGPATCATQGGVLDTFTKSELTWEFSITRLMVPFLPALTLGVLNEKLNSVNSALGNLSVPLLTARFIAPEPPPLLRAPDGATFYNITYRYRLRKLLDEYFDDVAYVAGGGGAYPKGIKKGWVDWNHHLGIPSARVWPNLATNPMTYYPVCWNDGQFQLFGTNHPLYLRDQDMSGLVPPPVPGVGSFALFNTEFTVGFQPGQ